MATWLENESMRKEKWRPGGDDFGFGYGMDGIQPPPVSIEDRSIVGIVDRGLNSTNDMPEVGGSRNR